MSAEFDDDSTKIKGAINLLASAAGTLKRAGGKRGQADATFLTKKSRFYKPPEVLAKEPTTTLSPELQRLAGPSSTAASSPASAPKSSSAPARAVWPTVRKKQPNEAFDRWINEVIELAVADHAPTWWDEL
jgi:hypothetical protein